MSIAPQIEKRKALGIVFLPGAMTGLILAGVDPFDAVLVQLALMYLILGAVVVTATLIVLGSRRRVFTADQRLIAISRSVRLVSTVRRIGLHWTSDRRVGGVAVPPSRHRLPWSLAPAGPLLFWRDAATSGRYRCSGQGWHDFSR